MAAAPRSDQVTRDPGCTRGLLWRVQLGPELDAEAARHALQGAGFEYVRQLGGVVFFAGAEETELVLVPRTGRVQIRLSYLLPFEDRAQRARDIGRTILRAFPR